MLALSSLPAIKESGATTRAENTAENSNARIGGHLTVSQDNHKVRGYKVQIKRCPICNHRPVYHVRILWQILEIKTKDLLLSAPCQRQTYCINRSGRRTVTEVTVTRPLLIARVLSSSHGPISTPSKQRHSPDSI